MMNMRIGISVVTHQGQNIWENGLGQNIVFLADLLLRLSFVQSVILIDVGDQANMPPQVDLKAYRLRLMKTREATDEVDVIIEMGGALDIEWLDLMRSRGKKVVFFCCGQPYVGLAEAAVFAKPSHASRPDHCDEVWLLPKDILLEPLMRMLHRCDVQIAPYIWHPQFIEQRITEVVALGLGYGYVCGQDDAAKVRAGLSVAIFEPNISVVKASIVPMLICDEAYRADRSTVQAMHVLNTLHLKDHPTMLYLANSLDLVREHKATFYGRHDIVGFMAEHADVSAVVSHQWQNQQNYCYLDVLYGNYPLIHNSPWLQDAGYYYPNFDILQGAAQLQHAQSDHHRGLADYRARSRRVFDAVAPGNPNNLEGYAARLLHLCRDAKFAETGSRA